MWAGAIALIANNKYAQSSLFYLVGQTQTRRGGPSEAKEAQFKDMGHLDHPLSIYTQGLSMVGLYFEDIFL